MSRLILLFFLVAFSMTFCAVAVNAQTDQSETAVVAVQLEPACDECASMQASANITDPYTAKVQGPVAVIDIHAPAPASTVGDSTTPSVPHSLPVPPDPTMTGNYAIDSCVDSSWKTDLWFVAPRPTLPIPLPGSGVVMPSWVSPSLWGYRVVTDIGSGYVSCFKANVRKACFRIVKEGQSNPIVDIHFCKWQNNRGQKFIGVCNTGKRLNFNPVTISYSYGAVHDATYRIALEIGLWSAAAWAFAETVAPQIWYYIQQLPAYGI